MLERVSTTFTRRRMLKWLGLGAAGAMLAGCGSAPAPTAAPAAGGTPKPATGSPAAGTTPVAKQSTISFSTPGDPIQLTMFESILVAFEKANPNIKVERRFDPSLTWEKVHIILGAGTASSVQRANDDDIFLLRAQGVIQGIDKYIERDLKRADYLRPAFGERLAAGGEVCACTPSDWPLVLYYNTKHLEEAGITPAKGWTEAWTVEQFEDACRKLIKKDASGKINRYPYSEVSWVVQHQMDNWGAVRYNDCETECTLNKTSNALDSLTWHQNIYVKEKWGMPYAENSSQMFNSGFLSMHINHLGFRTNIGKDIPWDVMPIPFGRLADGKKGKNYTECSENCWVIPTAEKNPDVAWELMRYLLTEPGQEVIAKSDFAVPCLRKVAEGPLFNDPAKPPKNRQVFFQGVDMDVKTHDNPMGDDFQKWFSRTTNELTDGTKPAKAFLEERVQRLNEKIKETEWDKCKNWVKGWKLGEKVSPLVKPGMAETATAKAGAAAAATAAAKK